MAIDDVGLGNSVHAPFNPGAAFAVEADAGIGVADIIEKGARLLRRVLPYETVQLDAAGAAELRQLRCFGATWQAPGGEDVHHGHPAAGQLPGSEAECSGVQRG